jgi:hypothetical protein
VAAEHWRPLPSTQCALIHSTISAWLDTTGTILPCWRLLYGCMARDVSTWTDCTASVTLLHGSGNPGAGFCAQGPAALRVHRCSPQCARVGNNASNNCTVLRQRAHCCMLDHIWDKHRQPLPSTIHPSQPIEAPPKRHDTWRFCKQQLHCHAGGLWCGRWMCSKLSCRNTAARQLQMCTVTRSHQIMDWTTSSCHSTRAAAWRHGWAYSGCSNCALHRQS